MSHNIFPILFADDTYVFIVGDNLDNMTVSMNKGFCKLVLYAI